MTLRQPKHRYRDVAGSKPAEGTTTLLSYSIIDKSINLKRVVFFNSFEISIIMEFGEDISFAELIGIMLGDGNIYDSGRRYILGISINRIDSPRNVNYVENLLFRIFKIKPKVNIKNDSKNLELRYLLTKLLTKI